ncbi:MAG: VWA domain-containing protein [Clostridia bacterium]|nr:VWA domain-containing protein [Clostridia bacterium]
MSEEFMPAKGAIPVTGSTKALLTLFIVDTSGSMTLDSRIEKVNEAFADIVKGLQQRQDDVGDSFTIFISILGFNQEAKWLVEPTPISEFNFHKIEASRYVTYFGEAMKEVNNQLSRSKLLLSKFKGKIAAPYIMFMTDGYPTEEEDYESIMDQIAQNAWFQGSQRYAVLIGEEATSRPEARRAVARIVKNPKEGIITVADARDIAEKVTAATLIAVDNMTKHGVQNQERGYDLDGFDSLDQDDTTHGTDLPPFPTDEDVFKGLFPGNF